MEILYKPASGPEVTVKVISADPYVRLQGDEPAGVEASLPSVFARLAALPADPELDDPIITINGTAYRVTERKPAGLGAIRLMLRKA
jgi:hypothetical protein